MMPQISECCIGFLGIPKILLYEATVITLIFMKYSAQKVEAIFKNGEKWKGKEIILLNLTSYRYTVCPWGHLSPFYFIEEALTVTVEISLYALNLIGCLPFNFYYSLVF